MNARIYCGNCGSVFRTLIPLETVTNEWDDGNRDNMTCLIRYECPERRSKLLLEFIVKM